MCIGSKTLLQQNSPALIWGAGQDRMTCVGLMLVKRLLSLLLCPEGRSARTFQDHISEPHENFCMAVARSSCDNLADDNAISYEFPVLVCGEAYG